MLRYAASQVQDIFAVQIVHVLNIDSCGEYWLYEVDR